MCSRGLAFLLRLSYQISEIIVFSSETFYHFFLRSQDTSMDGDENNHKDNIRENDEQKPTCGIGSEAGERTEEGSEGGGLKSRKHLNQ